MLAALLPFHGVKIITGAKAKKYENGTLSIDTCNGEEQIACDSFILSVGYQEENALIKKSNSTFLSFIS